jgi:hypothetical protein
MNDQAGRLAAGLVAVADSSLGRSRGHSRAAGVARALGDRSGPELPAARTADPVSAAARRRSVGCDAAMPGARSPAAGSASSAGRVLARSVGPTACSPRARSRSFSAISLSRAITFLAGGVELAGAAITFLESGVPLAGSSLSRLEGDVAVTGHANQLLEGGVAVTAHAISFLERGVPLTGHPTAFAGDGVPLLRSAGSKGSGGLPLPGACASSPLRERSPCRN